MDSFFLHASPTSAKPKAIDMEGGRKETGVAGESGLLGKQYSGSGAGEIVLWIAGGRWWR